MNDDWKSSPAYSLGFRVLVEQKPYTVTQRWWRRVFLREKPYTSATDAMEMECRKLGEYARQTEERMVQGLFNG